MDILQILDTQTLKLINKSSSYTFSDKEYYFFDRDYGDELKTALSKWKLDRKNCIRKYGHISFWDTSSLRPLNYPEDIDEKLLWKNT